MIFGEWRQWLNNLSRNTRGRAAGRKMARSARPGLELMEARAVPAAGFFQGFEIGSDGWNAAAGRVASGTHGVTSRTGNFHGEIAQGGGAFTWFGPSAATGYTSTFPKGGFTTSVDVYLDPTGRAAAGTANDMRFDYTSAISNAAGGHRRDFAFNAGYYNDAGEGPRFVISASNNVGRGNSFPKNPGRDPFAITTSGWYTFQHRFFDNGNGVLAVQLSIKDASGATQHTWTMSDATDVIGSTVGGNRYGWFATQELPFLAIENSFQSNPSAVYVDDDWASLAVGTDPDGSGPANLIGFDAFSSIQDAINAASGGGTVNVAAGTYNEKITVNKSVNLVGAQAGVDARDGRPGADESVLNGLSGATPLYVTASNVTVDGFTIQGNTSGNQFGFGILLGAGTSGSQVLNNIIQDNVVGLGLANNSAANQTVIQNNLFRNNNNTGPAGGNAIYSDEYVAGGALTNVLIDANRFEGHNDAAVNLSASVPGSQSAIIFSNNDVVDNGRAGFLFNVVNSTFSNNTVSDSTFVGSADFRIFGGVQNVNFTGNFLSDGAGDAIRVTGTNNSDLLVQGNSITGYTGDGLEVVSGAYTGGPLDATGNWWGANTAAGVAAEIVGNVDFTPFLLTGVDTSVDSGFQGDASVAPGEGSVRVKVVGKRLMISGDNMDNQITIEKGPIANSYRVTGLAGTQINGRSGSFVFENVTRGIDAHLAGGDDMLVLDGSASPFTVTGTIKVGTGRGDDLVRLQGVSVSGKSDLASWSGNDYVQLIDSDFNGLAVKMGNGKSTRLELEGVTVTGRTAVYGGNGADTVRVVNSDLGVALIRTGFGNDAVSMDRVHATGRVQVETGRHNDMMAVTNSTFDAAVVLGGGFGNDELNAGILGTPNTNGNTFVDPVTRGFETELS